MTLTMVCLCGSVLRQALEGVQPAKTHRRFVAAQLLGGPRIKVGNPALGGIKVGQYRRDLLVVLATEGEH